MTTGLQFSRENAKLQNIQDWASMPEYWGRQVKIHGFSLPAGYTCPAAKLCLSKADRVTGKITDGKYNEFRCFMASIEAYSPQLREMIWKNFNILRETYRMLGMEGLVSVLYDALPDTDIVRIDVDGDFFNQAYFDAWVQVARLRPDVTFYAYTKSLNFWEHALKYGGIPDNLKLTASYGGDYDDMINGDNGKVSMVQEYGIKSARVVLNPEEADRLELPIDHDEWHAIAGTQPFALLLHGTQPKGSKAAAALKDLKLRGIKFAYSK